MAARINSGSDSGTGSDPYMSVAEILEKAKSNAHLATEFPYVEQLNRDARLETFLKEMGDSYDCTLSFLGKGSYSKAYEMSSQRVLLVTENDPKNAQVTKTALEQLNNTRCPHVPIQYATHEKPHIFASVQNHAGADLYQLFLKNGRSASIQEIESVAHHILHALQCAHKQNRVHGDIKPQNICYSSNGAVLIDWGVSTQIENGWRKGINCSIHTRSPEEDFFGVAGPSSDIRSLGATLHELLTGHWSIPRHYYPCQQNFSEEYSLIDAYLHYLPDKHFPFEDYRSALGLTESEAPRARFRLLYEDDAMTRIRENHPQLPSKKELLQEHQPSLQLERAWDLIQKMLALDPRERPTAEEALQHPFFQSISSSELSFRIHVLGENSDICLRIKSAAGNLLKEIDLEKYQKSPCHHIPKHLGPYRFELYSKANPEKTLKTAIPENTIQRVTGQLTSINGHEFWVDRDALRLSMRYSSLSL